MSDHSRGGGLFLDVRLYCVGELEDTDTEKAEVLKLISWKSDTVLVKIPAERHSLSNLLIKCTKTGSY